MLFVSHNMAAIANLCNKCLFIRSGELRRSGSAQAVIENYLHDGEELVSSNLSSRMDRTATVPCDSNRLKCKILTELLSRVLAVGTALELYSDIEVQVQGPQKCPLLFDGLRRDAREPISSFNFRIWK